MSDILTIDTSAGIQQVEKVEALPVHDENFALLQTRIPEYNGEFPNAGLQTLAKRLRYTMKLYSGLGLAANQCGAAERMFVIGTQDFQLTCLNPRVVDEADSDIRSKEGCLSFPGMFVTKPRPEWIEVEFLDEFGTKHNTRLEGLSARCFLHELDHLNGVRMIDDMKPLALRMAREKAQKMVKKVIRKAKRDYKMR